MHFKTLHILFPTHDPSADVSLDNHRIQDFVESVSCLKEGTSMLFIIDK